MEHLLKFILLVSSAFIAEVFVVSCKILKTIAGISFTYFASVCVCVRGGVIFAVSDILGWQVGENLRK